MASVLKEQTLLKVFFTSETYYLSTIPMLKVNYFHLEITDFQLEKCCNEIVTETWGKVSFWNATVFSAAFT